MKNLSTFLFAVLLGCAGIATYSVRHNHSTVVAGVQQNPVPSCPIDPSQCGPNN